MKTTIRITAVVAAAIMAVSCIGRPEKKPQETETVQTDDYRYVHLVPDSLRTEEDKKLVALLEETIVRNLTVKVNHLVFPLSEADFQTLGIPAPYYRLMMRELDNANRYIDSVGIKNMDSILKASYRELYAKYY